MAIDKIKKALFIVPCNIFEEFLIGLKNISSVEIISQQDIKSSTEQLQFLNYSYNTLKTFTPKIDFLINTISKYHLTVDKESLYNKEVCISKNLNDDLNYISTLYTKIEQIDKEIKHIHSRIQHLEHRKSLIENFVGINLSISKLQQIKNYKYYFLKVSSKHFVSLETELQKLQFSYYWLHRRYKDACYIFVLVHNNQDSKFLELTKSFEVQFLNFTGEFQSDTIEEEIKLIENEIQQCKVIAEQYNEQTKTLLLPNIKKIFEVYRQIRELEDFILVQQNITSTKYSRVIYCWLPEKFITKVKNFVSKFPEVAVLFFEPSKGEDVPTVLKNQPAVEPYEFITTLYGYPKPTGIDPTGLLAPFFTLFFALCLSDVFYGVLLIVAWWLLKDKISKHSEYYKLVSLFKYLGFVSVIIGFSLDSFLGFSVIRDFKLPLNVAIFDPLNRPVDMLKFTFLLGYIQIIFGISISAAKNIKDKDFLSAVDNLSWVLFITIFAPVVYNLFFPHEIPLKVINIAARISVLVFLFIVLFQSRNIKNVLLKPINVLVKAYNVIGFYADILSYSRILALALASSCIAQTINLIVMRLFKAELLGIKFVEPIFAPIVFLGGHIFNFVISCLGALVHSARLQYLEFFSKFFVSGGRPIKLFSPMRK